MVQTSNSPASNISVMRWPISSALANEGRGLETSSRVSMISPPYSRRNLVATLAPDAEDLDRLAFLVQLVDQAPDPAHDRGIEAAAEAAVGGADHNQVHLVAARVPRSRAGAPG